MISDRFITQIAVVLTFVGFLSPLLPLFANDVIPVEEVEAIETPTGTAGDLEDLETRNASEWGWGVGGEDSISETSETESGYQADPSALEPTNTSDSQDITQKWGNRGDVEDGSLSLPIADF